MDQVTNSISRWKVLALDGTPRSRQSPVGPPPKELRRQGKITKRCQSGNVKLEKREQDLKRKKPRRRDANISTPFSPFGREREGRPGGTVSV